MLDERAQTQDQYENERTIFRLAEREPGSWAAAISDHKKIAGIGEPPWRSIAVSAAVTKQMVAASRQGIIRIPNQPT